MILVAWWNDNIESKEIFEKFPLLINDPYINFVLTYGYMCLADKKTMQSYIKNTQKNTSLWMKNYIDIELLGRLQRFKDQAKLVKKLNKNSKYLEDYIKVALLQSLENNTANIKYIQQYINSINLMSNKDSLSLSLCVRAEIIHIIDTDINSSSLLKHRYIMYRFLQNDLLEVLKSLDLLAQENFLNLYSLMIWFKVSEAIPQGKKDILKRLEYAISLVPNSILLKGIIASHALIYFYNKGEYELAFGVVRDYKLFANLSIDNSISNLQIYFKFISKLCYFQIRNSSLYFDSNENSLIEVFGESHSLSISNIKTFFLDKELTGNAHIIQGIKMHHLKLGKDTFYSKALQLHLKEIKPNSELLFTIGEIDCRPDEGIWDVHSKKNIDIDKLIKTTTEDYIEFLSEKFNDKLYSSITIQGIPAPGYKLNNTLDSDEAIEAFLSMIKKVNISLKLLTLKKKWNFLDVYGATVGKDGRGNNKWHLDFTHLKPSFYAQEADKWLIKPEPKKQETKPNTIDFSQYSTVSLSKPN